MHLDVDAVGHGPFSFSQDGKLYAAVHIKGIALWDVVTRKKVADLPFTRRTREPVLRVSDFRFSPDSKSIATWYNGHGGICLWALPEIQQAK